MLSLRMIFLRKMYHMTQAQLAQKLHISPSAVGMYEQGRRVPDLQILVEMSRLFRVSLDYLITGAEFQPPDPQTEPIPPIFLCPYCPMQKNKY